MQTVSQYLEFEIIRVDQYSIQVYTLVSILCVILFTKLLLWTIQKTLLNKKSFRKLDRGSAYAIFQIARYLVWVISIAFILEIIGVKLSVLIAGSAALLVGIGLGLQQTFNDIISGIILLSEQSIKIDDVLEIDGDVVKIQSIGLRTSKCLNTDDITIIIPNSLITTNKVINWSHQTKKTRFRISVGVAYGSDVDRVINILEASVLDHPEITDKNAIEARLVNFGDSSLDFQILFYSDNNFRINKIKSDIRRIIHKNFNENNISIPFPQMDVHLKNMKL